ncbi:hypothetical protein ACLB2K_045032 [Fragaria x ananassa]
MTTFSFSIQELVGERPSYELRTLVFQQHHVVDGGIRWCKSIDLSTLNSLKIWVSVSGLCIAMRREKVLNKIGDLLGVFMRAIPIVLAKNEKVQKILLVHDVRRRILPRRIFNFLVAVSVEVELRSSNFSVGNPCFELGLTDANGELIGPRTTRLGLTGPDSIVGPKTGREARALTDRLTGPNPRCANGLPVGPVSIGMTPRKQKRVGRPLGSKNKVPRKKAGFYYGLALMIKARVKRRYYIMFLDL